MFDEWKIICTHSCQTGAESRWDGKISETSWRNPGETSDREYKYRYDNLSRLTAAEYVDASDSGQFTERYGYDLNGNMTSKTKTVQINNGLGNVSSANMITHKSYTGNRMRSMPMSAETYDACGRYTGAAGLASGIEYNEIGLPSAISLRGSSHPNVVYAADGRKLKETVTTRRPLNITTRSYAGNCIYEDNTLKKVLFESGFVDMSGSSPAYMFFLTDHLGSVRVVAAQDGTVKQVNQYYPYGNSMPGAAIIFGGTDSRYRFVSKELVSETGLHDFGARYLAARYGRFTTIDPLAEKYPSVSPYAYCAGDPVNMVDSTGKFPIVANVIGAIAGAAIDYSAQVAGNLIAGKSIKEALTDIDYVDVAVSAAEGFLTMGASTVGKIVVKEAAVVVAGAFDYDNDTKQVKLNDSTKTMANIALGHVVQPFNGPSVKVFKTTTPTKAVNAAKEKAHLKGNGLATSEAKKIAAKTRTNNLNVQQANKEISSMSEKSLDHAFSTGTIKYLDEK